MNVESITLFVAIGVGVSVFWSNPRRMINQGFALASVFVAVWVCLLWAINSIGRENPVPWIKATSAVGAFFPWVIWWLANCIISPDSKWAELFSRGKFWFGSSMILAAIAASNWFIPTESTRDTRLWGGGAVVYNVGLLANYFSLVVLGVREARRQKGIQLVEIRIFLIGGSISGLVGLVLTMVAPMLGLHGVRGFAPLAVLSFYGLTAWGITNQKVFDARRLFLVVLRRFVVLGTASVLLSLWLSHVAPHLPAGLAMLLGVTACVAFVFFIERLTRTTGFTRGVEAAEAVRAAILSAGRDEVDPDALIERYGSILREWGRVQKVSITAPGSGGSHNPWSLAADGPGLTLLQNERWATPESLGRRRLTPAVDELDRYMAAQKFSVLVLSPQARGATPIAIGLGQREDEMPFLYPEIQNLMEWSELMEVALSRVQLTKRARETEQVATAGLLGASLAHEIRNPLVALKTFAQLLPERHNDPEFRDEFSKLLQKEVGRIEGLTEQLLKLSTPRQPVMRAVRLNEIVLDCAALLKPKFAEGRTTLELDLTPDERPIQADSGSLSQVVINLLVNALQALGEITGERRVYVRTTLTSRELNLEISDNGPGVPLKQRERLFRPFSSGKVNGFGLGLALSANIMRVHKGSIALVETGRPGATFRLTFPCPPS